MREDRLESVFNKIIDLLNIKINKKNRKLVLQIFKFVIVGGLAFIIDYVVLILCKEILKIDVLFSAAIAFTVSVIVNYILSVKWIFEIDKDKKKSETFIIFILFSVMGLGLTELIMWIGSLLLNYNYLIVKIIATAIVMVFNFITRKLFLEKRN